MLAAVDLTCNFNAKPFVDMLFDVIADDMPPIESLNLEGNNIATLSHFKQCAEEHNLLGFVRNLNLTNNQLHRCVLASQPSFGQQNSLHAASKSSTASSRSSLQKSS